MPRQSFIPFSITVQVELQLKVLLYVFISSFSFFFFPLSLPLYSHSQTLFLLSFLTFFLFHSLSPSLSIQTLTFYYHIFLDFFLSTLSLFLSIFLTEFSNSKLHFYLSLTLAKEQFVISYGSLKDFSPSGAKQLTMFPLYLLFRFYDTPALLSFKGPS